MDNTRIEQPLKNEKRQLTEPRTPAPVTPGLQTGDEQSTSSDETLEPVTRPPTPRESTVDHSTRQLKKSSKHVEGYEILAELGRGGMGVVYKAKHLALNRIVALKMILSGGHAGMSDLLRFRTEAEAVARLQHPGIVQIHEIGDRDGLPYFSLEYCSGGSLAQQLNGTPLPPKQAASMVKDLAQAMDAAHRAKIIHRDLKPANVLLAADGSPKITDFGLAKKLDEAGQTASGAVMGTPSYMAPEQAAGHSNIGPPADVYALGAILYEILTGRAPFRADTAIDTIMQVIEVEPAPPRQLQAKVPRDLEVICLKCLRKEPAKRYTSAAALADDLGRFLSDEPIQARPVSKTERTIKWIRRRPAVSALAACVVLLTFLGFGLVTWKWQEAVAQKEFADSETARANREKDQADREKQRAQKALDKSERLRYSILIQSAHREWLANNMRLANDSLASCPSELRGWEWFYINRLCSGGAVTLGNFAEIARGSAFSPDGRHIAVGHGDPVSGNKRPLDVVVIDLASGEIIKRLKGHNLAVVDVAYSPDGKWIAGASRRNNPRELEHETVIVWNATTGETIQTIPGFGSVEFGSMSGQMILASERTNLAQIVDCRTWKPLHKITFADKTILSRFHDLAVDPHGRYLAIAVSREVMIYNIATGDLVRRIATNASTIAFSHDAQRIVTSPPGTMGLHGRDRGLVVGVWDIADGRKLFSLKGFKSTQPVQTIACSPDGKWIATGSGKTWGRRDGGEIKVWDAKTGAFLFDLKGHTGVVYRLQFNHDSKKLLSTAASGGGGAGQVKIWSFERPQISRVVKTGFIAGMAVNPKTGRFVTLGSNERGMRSITFWDVDTGRRHHEILPGVDLSSITISRDGKWMAVGSELPFDDPQTADRNAVQVWNLKTGNLDHKVTPHTFQTLDLAFRPGSAQIACVGGNPSGGHFTPGVIRVWDFANRRVFYKRGTPKRTPTTVAFSRDGQLVATGDTSGFVVICDASSGIMRAYCGNGFRVRDIVFSADGDQIISCGDKLIRICDVATGKRLMTLKGHTDDVICLSLHPTEPRLASGSKDGTVRIWDTSTGQLLLTLKGHTAAVKCVAFTPDGRNMISSSADETIRIWDTLE